MFLYSIACLAFPDFLEGVQRKGVVIKIPALRLLGGSSHKWLGSPPFISHEWPFGRGPTTLLRGTYDHHGY